MPVQKINNSRWRLMGGSSIPFIDTLPRNIFIVGLLFTTLIFQTTESMPSRLMIRSVDDDSRLIFSGAQYPVNKVKGEKRTMKRETFRRGNDVGLSGDFVFPSDDSDEIPNLFIPGPHPECRSKTYCENTAYYPSNYVNNVIKLHDDLKFMTGIDVVENVVHRIGGDTTSLCVSEERLIYPTSAQNQEKDWLFVMNQENFRQGVRIETCVNPDGGCAFVDGFVEGYKSICKQKYIFRQLAAISPNGTAIRDMFKLPASCCCHLKLEPAYSRMGISLLPRAKQTPVSKRQRPMKRR